MVDGGELFDVGLEERFGGGVVEGFDVGVDVAADTLEGGDEAMEERGEVSVSILVDHRVETGVTCSLSHDWRKRQSDGELTPQYFAR